MKITRALLISVVLIVSVSSTLHPATLEKDVVSGTAEWVVHLNARRFWQTELIDRIIENFQGSDPVTEIDSFTVYGPGTELTEAAIVIRSDFDRDRIISLLENTPEYEEYTYDGDRVHSWEDGTTFFGAFPASDRAILSPSQASLEHGLEVLKAKEPDIQGNENFAMLEDAPAEAFIVGFTEDAGDIIAEQAGVDIPGGVKALAYGIESDGVIELKSVIKTADAQTAAMLGQLLDGLLAMAELNPDLAAFEELIRAVDTDVENETITVDFSYCSEAVFDILMEKDPR